MKSLSDLYQKKVPATEPAVQEKLVQAPPFQPKAEVKIADAKTSEPKKNEAPVMETPPGLPQEYIDVNLKNQPLPPVLDVSTFEQEKEKPLNIRLLPGESLCNATDIPYTPGYEPKIVTARIDQGPRAFVSRVQQERFNKDFDEKNQKVQAAPKGPTLAHPDTLRPGTFIKGESPAYRPG